MEWCDNTNDTTLCANDMGCSCWVNMAIKQQSQTERGTHRTFTEPIVSLSLRALPVLLFSTLSISLALSARHLHAGGIIGRSHGGGGSIPRMRTSQCTSHILTVTRLASETLPDTNTATQNVPTMAAMSASTQTTPCDKKELN